MKKITLISIVLTLVANITVSTFSFAQYTKLIDFTGAANGASPTGSLISDGNFLYGMTEEGGTNNMGTIFKIKPDGTGYFKLLNFNGTNGSNPHGSLISDGTFLYGMTSSGGNNNAGVVFKIKPNATGYIKLYDFINDGAYLPKGSLFYDGIYLYGMTLQGATSGNGIIFKIKTDGTGYAKLHDFTSTTGNWASGSLISDGTVLYGMTQSGGINNDGVIFKIMPDGTGYSILHNFDGSALRPYGSLISDGTFLYGMTRGDQSTNFGTIFKMQFDGTGYSNILNFPVATANTLEGDLISDGTFLYGMTKYGGVNSDGVIFKIRPDGTGYTKLVDFAGVSNGKYPCGSLISDGTFLYGMTNMGGTNNMGVIFKCLSANCYSHYSTTYDSIPNTFTLFVDNNTAAIAVAYNWDFGDGTTSILATPTHIYTVDSLYNVCMKIYTATGDSCTYCHIIGKDSLGNIIRTAGFTLNVQNATTTTSTSESTSDKTSIIIYPNPTNGNVTLSGKGITAIEIYNVIGEKIYSQSNLKPITTNEIDLSKSPKGIYLINIYVGTKIYNKKIVVQ